MKKLLTFFAVLLGAGAFAQQDEQMSLYMQNPLYYNPAYAGSRQSLSLVGMGRFQWVDFNGAPTTQWFSVHSPIAGGGMGLGAHFVNDRIGSRNRTAAYVDVSSSIRLNRKGDRLAVGLSGGADFLSFNFTDLNVKDIADPYYGKQFSETRPNLGAGIYYYGTRHFVGISSPRVFEVKANDVTALVSTLNKRHYFFTAGIVVPLSSVVMWKPTLLLKYTPNAPLTADLGMNFLFYDKIWLGAMYRYNEAVGLNLIVKIKDKLQIGYGYDFPVNGLRTYQNGSHELLLTYDVNFKKHVYNSPRYF